MVPKHLLAIAALLPFAAQATSSGSFTASVDNEACTINGTTGTLSSPVTGQVFLTPASGMQIDAWAKNKA